MTDDRGTGRTSAQIVAAPRSAFFICQPGVGCMAYTRALAKMLGREDLKLATTDLLDRGDFHVSGRQIIIDHAVALNDRQRILWQEWQSRFPTQEPKP